MCYQTAIVVRRKKYIMFCFNLNYLIKKVPPPPFFPECWLCLRVPLRCLFKLPPHTYQWADRLLFPGVTQSESWSLALRNQATLFLCLLNPDWSLCFSSCLWIISLSVRDIALSTSFPPPLTTYLTECVCVCAGGGGGRSWTCKKKPKGKGNKWLHQTKHGE